MEVSAVVDMLLKIKEDYPILTNDEILKILEIKTLIETKARIRP